MNWKQVTIYTVTEMADEDGHWRTIGTYNSEQDAKKVAGRGYRRIEIKSVYSEGPLKGANVSTVLALPRYPIDQAMRDVEKEKQIRSKLTDTEWAWLEQRNKS